jgi:ABC-type dipeptide/oligopeptide/nickel transport system permease subunit
MPDPTTPAPRPAGAPATALAAVAAAPRGRSLGQRAFERLRRNPIALISLAYIVGLIVVALFAPLIAPYGYATVDFTAITQPPSDKHWLGTDQLGRDVLSRLIHGARVSLSVAFVAQAIILLIGVPIGLASGYIGGRFDLIVQRVVDVLYAFPSLLFVIIVMTFVQANLRTASGPIGDALVQANRATGGLIGVFIALGLIFWLTVARLVRAEVLKVKTNDYIDGARSLGANDWQIVRRHVFPNVLPPIIVATTLGLPSAIMIEAGLSFLGLGVAPPTPSWGLMIADAVPSIRAYPHMILAPAIALSLTLLAFNFLGDALRDALDPWMSR